MKKDNLNNIKKTFLTIIFILLLIIFFSLLFRSRDNNLIKNIKSFIESDIKVLYISDKDSYSDYPIELFKKYDTEYLYINSSNLSGIEKSKLKKVINSKYLNDIIVIFKDGKVKDAIIEYKDEEQLLKFLKNEKIIPGIIDDNSNIIPRIKELLNEDLYLIYIPYKVDDDIDMKKYIFENISIDYNINYEIIPAYLLSENQQEKLNTLLQISSVEDYILILVKDKKIVGSIRNIENEYQLLTGLEKFNFINKISLNINYIDYDKFTSLAKSKNKTVVTIVKDECKYCENVVKILNDISFNYNVDINYINIENINSSVSKKLEVYLNNLGYKDGFTTPLTILVENDKLLNYIVGTSDKDYFIEIFKENGIIK